MVHAANGVTMCGVCCVVTTKKETTEELILSQVRK